MKCVDGKERKERRHDSEVFGWDLSAWWLVGFSSEFLTFINTSGNEQGDVCRSSG